MASIYLPALVAAQVVGIVVGGSLAARPAGPFFLLTVLLLLAGLVALRRPRLQLVLLVLASTGAGTGATLARRAPVVEQACSVARLARRSPVRLEAEVLGPAVVTTFGQRVLLRAAAVHAEAATRPVCGNVELRLPAGAAPLWTGERIMVQTRLRPAVPGRNPGAVGPRLRYLSDQVVAVGYAGGEELVIISRADPPALEGLRRRIRTALEAGVPEPTPRAILGAMVLGDRGAVDRPLRERFARAGVSHLLAVSGLHLSFVAGGAMLLLTLLLRRFSALTRRFEVRVIAAPLAGGVAVCYTLLTGAAPSTTRACVMTCAVLLGVMAGRTRDLVRPLCLAALLLLALDPLNLARPGFQLSFAAVAGIALVVRWRASLPWPRPRPGLVASRIARLLRGARDLTLTSVAATLITGPVVAHHFGQVSMAGVVTNLLAIPGTTLFLLPLGLLGALLGAVKPCLGAPLLQAAAWAAERLDQLCGVTSSLELVMIDAQPGWLVTLGLCGLTLALLAGRPWRRPVGALAAALLVTAAVLALSARVGQTLVVTFIDVGQGDGALLQLPRGGAVLIDAGGSRHGSWDPGASRVVPFLRARGVSRLDLVVASHPHADHVAGLVAVLEAVEVGELWTCWYDEPNEWHDRLVAAARAQGVPVREPRTWRSGGVVLQPLWPRGQSGACADPGFSANNNSVVLRLTYGASSALFTGDIEQPVEQRLVGQGARLRATLLKVPHHGSETSSSLALIRAVQPTVAVISSGSGNPFGLPDRSVVARYRRGGATVVRVDQNGAVEVQLEHDGAVSWRPLVHGIW